MKICKNNITEITNGQYTNAAITAGITDADIFVASPSPVTGESALVGVYKALEIKGEAVDPQRTKIAQEELETVTEIAEDNKANDKFDPKDCECRPPKAHRASNPRAGLPAHL